MTEGTGSHFPRLANCGDFSPRSQSLSLDVSEGEAWGSLAPITAQNPLLYPAYGPSNAGKQAGDRFLVLPGHGEAKTHCGEIRFGYACSNEHCEDHKHLHLYHENCGSMLCPTCHSKAEQRAARRITERIEGMKGAYEAEGLRFGPLDHVELSPPQDVFTEKEVSRLEGYRKAFEWANGMIRKYVHHPAGVLMFHPWRFKHLDGSTCERPDCKEKHKPVFSPHFHWCGYGYWKKSDEVHKATGAVYKKIRPGERRDLFATVSYELSHCGLLMEAGNVYDSVSHSPVEGALEYHQASQAYRYLGLFSNSKGGFKEESRSWDVQFCEKCQSEVHRYDLDIGKDGLLKPFRDIGPHLVLTIQGYWYICHRGRQATVLEKSGGPG